MDSRQLSLTLVAQFPETGECPRYGRKCRGLLFRLQPLQIQWKHLSGCDARRSDHCV